MNPVILDQLPEYVAVDSKNVAVTSSGGGVNVETTMDSTTNRLVIKDTEELLPGQSLTVQIKAMVRYSAVEATVEEIETLNILNAAMLAMRRAVAGLSVTPQLVLVDGNRDPGLELPTRLIVSGDATSASIAAASILAKVARDRSMEELAKQYPQYQFEKHKGYGTKAHYEAIRKYGLLPEHRRSFLKNLEAK